MYYVDKNAKFQIYKNKLRTPIERSQKSIYQNNQASSANFQVGFEVNELQVGKIVTFSIN
jgi:hypothetical protein